MSKKRRTKKEKMTAATRQNLPGVITLPVIREKSPSGNFESSHSSGTLHNHSHVIKDIRKTLILTSILILINIVLYIILKFRFINFQGLNF